ncbi:DUF4236 domain-containing protein [Curtobacterium sp. MCBD17_028]|uniref:DUF4236 domain-containing protein n=1 Tax=Curtobacterium sp. MCBD17_028 TaxID=2175670 RepID=UPI000DAA45A3|nr:DUF4236 domain-containing protein [Curtobacterium sp. MCBD17_028]PZE23868.1 DUF4236 domain-containing protein [Curtobacterium sp. MCBD17_028]
MGILFRSRRKVGSNLWLNLAKSGASLTARAGRASVNSRGRVTVRLAKGITWRIK